MNEPRNHRVNWVTPCIGKPNNEFMMSREFWTANEAAAFALGLQCGVSHNSISNIEIQEKTGWQTVANPMEEDPERHGLCFQ